MLAFFIFTSCEKYNFESEEVGQTEVTNIAKRSGEGTIEAPYTPSQLLSNPAPSSNDVWIIGYIIGSTNRLISNISFTVPTTNKTNIIIAQDTLCTSTDKCIPIELKPNLQSKISLNARPDLLHSCILIKGTPSTYFGQTGLRNAGEYYLLYDFDINTIDIRPHEWQEKNIDF